MDIPETGAAQTAIDRAEALLGRMASMGYDPSDFRIDEFIRWLEGLTGREVQVVTAKLPFDLSGFWVINDEFNYICCDAGHPPFYTDHVVTHEALHIFHAHLFRVQDAGYRRPGH
jgi:hypothetical protein